MERPSPLLFGLNFGEYFLVVGFSVSVDSSSGASVVVVVVVPFVEVVLVRVNDPLGL